MYEVVGHPAGVYLFGPASYQDCVDFLKRYTRSGNWGGYERFTVEDENGDVAVTLGLDEHGVVTWTTK